MKKILLAISFAFLIGFIPHVFAQGVTGSGTTGSFVPLTKIPGLTDVAANSAGLATFFNNLYKYLIGIAAVLAVIEIIWGGLEMMGESVTKHSKGRERITQAILGLVLVLSPVLVFTIINPSILNLSLNLPVLDTPTTTTTTGGVGTGIQTTTANGCTTTGIPGLLQIATCTSQAAATAWGESSCSSGSLSSFSETSSTNGVVTYGETCSSAQDYTFINEATYTTNLQPLVSTQSNPNNAADVINFTNICQSGASLGLETCINNGLINLSVPCNLTGANAATTWKCYNHNLTCEDSGFFSEGLQTCSGSRTWTPFQ